MTVKRIRRYHDQGHPILKLLIDGQTASIDTDQKFIRYGFDLVFLGAEWEDRVPKIVFPGDAERGLEPLRLSGFTADPAVVRLVRKFIADVDAGN